MYKINFTVEELSKFNTIERQKTKETLMSIYAYLLKLNEKKNDLYQNAGIGTDNISLKISFRKFLAAYNRYHSKISLPTLKFHIDKLKDLGLIAVHKVKNVFTYSFFRYKVNKKLNENMNTSNSVESIDNTDIEANEEKPKYLNQELSKDLDSTFNSCNATEPTVVDNFDYEKYISDQKKNITWDEVNTLLSRAFKLLKVRSHRIKCTVISKLSLYYSDVTRKHAMAYICACISDARIKYNNKRHENFIKYKYTQNENDTFNNFPQRDYDFEDLEKKLLGLI